MFRRLLRLLLRLPLARSERRGGIASTRRRPPDEAAEWSCT